ncbi:hypothetical protein Lal_00035529 [Lupinus albus]|nr:hypothetical protein Lal_00035529 [Lupinus albus]
MILGTDVRGAQGMNENLRNLNRSVVQVQALCPKLDRRPNVMHAGEARDHVGWLPQWRRGHRVLMIRREVNALVTVLTRLWRLGICARSLTKLVVLVPVSAKRVRTLLRRRDRYSFSKCHKRMSTRRNKCILIDMGSGVPHSLKFESVIGILNSWKPRLIERFSPERKRISWEGEILDYTGRFSPGREMAILGY